MNPLHSRKVLGPEHPDTLSAMSNLSNSYVPLAGLFCTPGAEEIRILKGIASRPVTAARPASQ